MSFRARAGLSVLGVVTIVGALANACSASNGVTAAAASGSGGGVTSTSISGAGGNLLATGTGGETSFMTATSGGPGATGTGGSCAAVSSEATSELQPADIIIAVDTSGSMDEEIAQVQQNLNAFAALIVASGIDVHVVLIADASMCIPAPLGNGACGGADEKLPAYRHVIQTVNSNDALDLIVSSYPQWKDALRPGATKTLAVVSDDDSNTGASAFQSALLALDPPTFQGFKFDAIVSFDDPGVCTGCFFNCAACASKCCNTALFCTPISAAEGKVYKQLVQQTGGVIGNLCIEDFAAVFKDMATSVVQGSKISCDYAIPIPDGGMINPGQVNVQYTPMPGSMPQPILNVPSAAGCGQNGGWYYDSPQNPTKIILCPGTCAAIQSNTGGKVDVLFGCDTVVKPPE